MTTKTNRFRWSLRRCAAGMLVALWVTTGSHALASGGGEVEDIFFMSSRPDQPVREFIATPAGFYPDYRVPYQVIWYWHLRGERFTPEALSVLAATLPSVANDDHQTGVDNAWKRWSQVRRDAYKTLGRPLAGAKDKDIAEQPPSRWNGDFFNNRVSCYEDAFANAASTLQQRMGHWRKDKAAAPSLLLWLAMQDWVFGYCGNATEVTSPVLPDTSPAWLKADYAYQRAAASFYAQEAAPLSADQAFEAIAADRTSPWKDLAAYMRLRTLARANPGSEAGRTRTTTKEDLADALKAQKDLTARVDAVAGPLLANPKLQALRPSIYRLREALRIRLLLPRQRMQVLANGLHTIGNPDVAAARILLLNHEMRVCLYAGCDALGPDQSDDLLLWLNTVRGFTGATPTREDDDWQDRTSWRAWQRSHALHWLFAAVHFVPDADTGRWASLQQALAEVPIDHPAGYAARQLRAMRLRANNDHAGVRNLLADAAASPLIAHSVSGQNLVKALLLPSAQTEDEWQRLAVRTVAGIRDPEAEDVVSPITLTTAFDRDVTQVLNRNAPLSLWLRLASYSRLHASTRNALLETAWTRAVLAEQFPMAREAARLRSSAQPPIPPLMARSMTLADTDRAGWRHVLMERMVSPSDTLRGPASETWYTTPRSLTMPAPAAPLFNALSGGSNKWCDAAGDAPDLTKQPDALRALAFLPGDEQRQHAVEIDRLRQVPIDSIYFTQSAMALMHDAPRDPLVPQALSVAVRMARFTCSDKSVGEWSRKGLQALHKNYPRSTWSAATRYWYR